MRLGVIADDFTGATDIAGFLVNNGLPTVQLAGPQDIPIPERIRAIVVSHKSRACPAQEAVDISLKTLEYLRSVGCTHFFFKYCSTFDSTPRGNIGPVTDALMKALGTDLTIITPALPVNKRTVYKGNLFVGDVPINESGMRNHPINPMTDANLMRVMQAQSAGKAGLVEEMTVMSGVAAVRKCLEQLREEGVSYAVTDTITDADLDVIAQACEGMVLVTGGSGLGGAMARNFSSMGFGEASATDGALPVAGRTILMSGSCSDMSNAQVARYAARGQVIPVLVERALEDADAYAEQIAEQARALLDNPYPPLVSATVAPDEVKRIQAAYGLEPSRKAIEAFFARFGVLMRKAGCTNFIIAGGETSSVVSQALGVTGFSIGPQIAPGVPWVRTLDGTMSLALKSGNFGAETFFTDALGYIPGCAR